MPTVLITGGTGTVGKRLTTMLVAKGYQVIVLTRNVAAQKPRTGVSYKEWNLETGYIDPSAVAEADHIIHLAGAGVADSKWTEKRKAEIVKSRTESSALLVKAARQSSSRLKTVVSASAIGWYAADKQRVQTEGFEENLPPAPGFLGETCKLWEESVAPFAEMGKRLVILRTGLVLSNDGGVIAEFKKPLKFGIATIMGSGEQVMSWIHIGDLCRMYIYALENEQLAGPYNAVAPSPASSKAVVLALAKQLRNKSFIAVHVPAFVLKAMLGEMSIEVLKSATISAAKIKAAGFLFLYPSLVPALEELDSEE
ncbi:TIGR01777 family protein [Filimonas effusa]|uniref:TIGR01777 family protein n=2 Tax=Filimonas effusa TaxID=2508721 RepID=A0A4Q1D133_9BACT|nr:TIGR01777 family protein [Filimonas effusa]